MGDTQNLNSIEERDILKSKTAKAFTNGSLAVLGVFVVLSYGLAACVLFVSKDTYRLARLVWILAISTPIFLCIGFVLVAWLHKKYYIGGQIKLLSKMPKQEQSKPEQQN